MLGRPPTFSGGKTEVHDFLDFKEQLYNILAYAELRYAEALKNLEALDDHDAIPATFSSTEHQTMSTKLYSLLSKSSAGQRKRLER